MKKENLIHLLKMNDGQLILSEYNSKRDPNLSGYLEEFFGLTSSPDYRRYYDEECACVEDSSIFVTAILENPSEYEAGGDWIIYVRLSED